ncbi:MAG: hypothetical protein AABX04_06440 [Nanoarchaeota archaeon]
MANDEDYEILPHQLLNDLKDEVEGLKKKLTQPDSKINELILEIESMKDSVHELNTIFQQALKETQEEDVMKRITDINDKLADVISQNETIAKGMLAISDKVDDFVSKQGDSRVVSEPTLTAPSGMVRHDMGMPQMSGPGRMAPPPSMDNNFPSFGDNFSGSDNFPPPPPSMGTPPKRKGLFK